MMQTAKTKSLNNGQFIMIKATEGKAGDIYLTENSGNPACSTALTRKAHRKSRTGCDQCKIRKIKCDERRPRCVRCLHKASTCVYSCDSGSSGIVNNPRHKRHSPSPLASVSNVTDSFTLQDLRLFHHFLIKATPYLPLGNQQTWSRDIPQLSHHSQFLMFSMLALGASHLRRSINDDSLNQQALTYRVRAIEGLREAMSQDVPEEVNQADAIIASCYSLMFASIYMSDGYWDWLSFLRLTNSVSSKIRATTTSSKKKSLFNLDPETHFQHIKDYLPFLPYIDIRLLRSAIESLDNLSNLLEDDQQLEFCNILRDVCHDHIDSPQIGYISFGKAFKFWLDLSEDAFHSFMISEKFTVQMLCAHFVAMLFMMLPMSVVENRSMLSYQTADHLEGMLGWVDSMCGNLPADKEFFATFPKSVVATVRDECKELELGDRPLVMQYDVAVELAEKLDKMQLGT